MNAKAETTKEGKILTVFAERTHHEGEVEKETWRYRVVVPEGPKQEAEIVEVQMNCDTIVCSADGYPFKTYPWTVGNTDWQAIIAAIRYLDYCFNQ